MRPFFVVLASLWLAAGVARPASAGCEPGAWNFGMSPAQLTAVEACGPYKAFRNGDLETYNGVYEGRKENFQFFFEQGRLRRIGIYLYEGQDPQAAAQRWWSLHGSMTRQYAGVKSSEGATVAHDEGGAGAFMAAALDALRAKGKIQMLPLQQAAEATVFSSFMRQQINGDTIYLVVLYVDPPRAVAAGKAVAGGAHGGPAPLMATRY